MSLWFVLALMTATAVLAVLWPLARRGDTATGGRESIVYKDQIAEIARDRAAGLIGVIEAEAARVEIDVNYVGFDIPSDFVIGYGLDYAERYRGLRDVAVLAPHVYS